MARWGRVCGALGLFWALAGCGSDDAGGDGPKRIDVALSASTADFAHTDGAVGQTAETASMGVRRLTLFTEADEPWVVVERADNPVSASLGAGARTFLGVVLPERLQKGRYVRARLVQEWVRFEIDATLHETDPTPGKLTALVVTSDGSELAGKTLDAGSWVHDFAGGTETGHWEGADAAVPEYSTSEGTTAAMDGSEWAIDFPVDLDIQSPDGTLTVTLNLHEAFRWTDVAEGENQPGTYDFAPPEHEPFVQLGPNHLQAAFAKR